MKARMWFERAAAEVPFDSAPTGAITKQGGTLTYGRLSLHPSAYLAPTSSPSPPSDTNEEIWADPRGWEDRSH